MSFYQIEGILLIKLSADTTDLPCYRKLNGYLC